MKTAAYWFSTILSLTLLTSSCDGDFFGIEPSGQIVTITPTVGNFDELSVSDDFKVYITFGNTEEVRLEVDANIEDRVVITNSGNTLSIEIEGNVSLRGDLKLEAYISTEFLSKIRGRGDAEIYLENEWNQEDIEVDLSSDSRLSGPIQANRLTVDLSSDAEMELTDLLIAESVSLDLSSDSEFLAAIESDRLFADLSGDSKLSLRGSSVTADIKAQGDSRIDDLDFAIQKLDIELKGDSEARLTVHESIDVRASGDSVLRFKGDAVIISQDLSGDSKVIRL